MLTAKDVHRTFNEYAHFHRGDWCLAPTKIGPFCLAIARAAEEDGAELEQENTGLLSEVKAMREERDTAWQKADGLEGQVARMAGALKRIQDKADLHITEGEHGNTIDWAAISNWAYKARQDAPTVVAHLCLGEGWLDETLQIRRFTTDTQSYPFVAIEIPKSDERVSRLAGANVFILAPQQPKKKQEG